MNRTFKGFYGLLVAGVLSLALMAGCGGGGGGGNVETINGIEVPPAPDTTANQAILSGVDVNGNGIRDDVDRLNAEEFGASPENYAQATNFALTLQAAITSPTQETTAQHVSLVSCETDSQKLSDLDKITTATLDTPERRAAYGEAFAGAVLSTEGCAQNSLAPSRSTALAQSINVVYINGINNTLVEAGETQTKIYETLNASINHTGSAKKSFKVSMIWNPVGWYGTKDDQWDLSQDKKELFLLKTGEEKFASYFREIMSPFNMSKTIDKAAATEVSAYLEDMTPGGNSLETDNKITDSDMQNTKKAVISLVDRIKARGSAIVVAHSQGNLLANLAYAKLASEYGNDVSKMVKIINVANTSEFSVNNLNFTHAGDAALFSAASMGLDFASDQSLETLPSRGSNWTRNTDGYCVNKACNFTIAPATFNAQNDIDGQGIVDKTLDHSIYETYLSTAIVTVRDMQGITFTANANRFVDRFEDFVYAAAESLSNAASGTAPSAPTGVSAAAGNGQVTISWNAVSGATSYNIYWSTSSGVTKTSGTKISNVSSPYAHTGRTNGTTYYYVVTAVNSYGESGESNQVSATPSSGTVSDTTAPSNTTASNFINSGASSTSSTSVTLAVSATDAVGVTAYYASETATTPSASASGWTAVTSTTSYSASVPFALSSTNGTKTIYVWFKDAAGNVSLSANDSINLSTGSAPSAPTGVSATAGNGQVTISWNAVTGATSYNIYWQTAYSDVPKTDYTKISNVTSPYTHTGRTNGTTYYYVVTAVNSYGESGESSQVSATPNATPTTTGKIPDTGQTTSYTSTFGEDHDYTINPPSYTDNGDGTITDNVTGLMWQKQDDGTARTWADAGAYCDASTLGGYSDWRLPSQIELISIIDNGVYYPSINTTFFPGTIYSSYWSSTTVIYNTSSAWDVHFLYGYSYNYDKTAVLYARCVRGGQTTQSLTDNGNGTVTDSGTLLTWQQGENSAMTWEAALSYCEGLSLAAQTDWRLPNHKELLSLVDYSRYNPSINTTFFPGTISSSYWSSSTSIFSTWTAWYVDFGGGSFNDSKADSYYARCVRGGE